MTEWTDEGIVLGTRRHSETGIILEVMTKEHGRHLGYVQGGISRKKKPFLQGGNGLRLEWKARLPEHMGHYTFELERSRAYDVISSPGLSLSFQTAAEHIRQLAERQSERGVHDALLILIESSIDRTSTLNLLLRFELRILEILGFGLELSACAVTGKTTDLAYVSPKSGRAISLMAGEEWKDRLLRLPDFLKEDRHAPDPKSLHLGLELTGFFLGRRVYEPKGLNLPVSRELLVDGLKSEIERLS